MGPLGPSWGHLGAPWGCPGPSWAHLRSIWVLFGHLEAILAASWGVLWAMFDHHVLSGGGLSYVVAIPGPVPSRRAGGMREAMNNRLY